MMALESYNKKRNFAKTNEPKGKKSAENKKLIFVVQYHKARAKHYDFRLEWKGVLLSWAVPKGPSFNPNDKRLAVHVEDHPVDYANFEGIIPEGNYGAGSVEIFDSGYYLPSFDMDKGLKKGHLKFVLFGTKLQGEWSLVKMDEKNWLLIKSDDEFAGKKKSQASKGLPFKQAGLMLAKLTDKIPSGKNWIFEIKYDGYRLLSFVQDGKVKCWSRGGQDYTKKFADVAQSLAEIDEPNFVVDGEVVAFDPSGKSDFGLLQQRLKSGEGQIDYCIFDILALNGEDVRGLPLSQRKTLLNRLFSKNRPHLMLSQYVQDNGKQCFQFAKENNLEGIVAKDFVSPYSATRNGDWLKIKCYARQEFVVCGYTKTDKNQVLSALILGYYQDKKLVFAGKVGTGFDQEGRKMLSQKLDKIAVKSCPIDVLAGKSKIDAIWTKPQLVAEIQYAELTKEGVLRQPSFVGLREDKKAKDVKLEVPNGK